MEFVKFFISKILKGLLCVLYIFPLNKNKVLFYPINGNYYCNLKYIDIFLRREYKNINIIWITKEKNFIKEDINFYKRNSILFFYHIMTSKVILSNSGLPSYIKKRKGQVYIETWHGGGAYKKIDVVYKNIKNKFERKRRLNKLNDIDYVISSCKRFSEVFKKDTDIKNVDFLAYGMPRNDIFFSKEKLEKFSKKIYDRYNIDQEKKIILYAPTFRNHHFYNNLDIDGILESLYIKFKIKYIFMVRCHPHIVNKIFEQNNEKNIIDVSSYVDMQELLCATDILITDYSSCMWDFSLMYKPCFIYANDLKEYKEERNFHTPIYEWPFPIATNNVELRNNILYFDQNQYIKKVIEHQKKLGSYETGNASRKIGELINFICIGDEK